jgi:hypothetical protein
MPISRKLILMGGGNHAGFVKVVANKLQPDW